MVVEDWLESVLPRHERLTLMVVALLEGMIKEAGIDYLSVSGRTKSHTDVTEKIERKEYRAPQTQLTDISGIRVITFFESQVDRVSELVKETFNIDTENSLDKSSLLGTDRLGYRSVHYVCDLGNERATLAEYKPFHGLKFEIQIRTVLQHAWAELAHDRTYKFSGVLPTVIQRQLNLYAGMLEIADRGFDDLAAQIDAYQIELDSQTGDSLLDLDVNSLSVTKYLQDNATRLTLVVEASSMNKLSEVVGELRNFGIKTLHDLDLLFTEKFIAAHNQHIHDSSFVGILRDAMMFADLHRYFSHSWDHESWAYAESDTIDLLSEKYESQTIHDVFAKNDVEIMY